VQVPELPQGIVDMHQILPSLDGVLDMQLTMMERYGIAKALIQSAPAEARSLWGNEKLIVLAAEHGDRFWISQFIDPRQHQAIPALEGLARAGAKVVKLLPPAGWQGDDPTFDEFWARMEELNLVAMIHTGFFTARHKTEEKAAGVFMNSRYANPVFFDRAARKFPDLQMILCHAGGAMWFEESAQMITQHDNVWGDISGFGHFALRRLLQLGVTVDWSKLFWGNDSPPHAYPFNLRLTLDSLRRAGADGMAEGLLYDNARQFTQQFLD
jgi:predicted TIM-barrel fold metal-dependent hydrolase